MSEKKETKHTPGPWTNEGTTVYADGKPVAFAACLLGRVDETRREGESWLAMRERTAPERMRAERESEANTRLMKSAPEMLDVLEMIRTVASAPHHPNALQAIEEMAHIAIAKVSAKDGDHIRPEDEQ